MPSWPWLQLHHTLWLALLWALLACPGAWANSPVLQLNDEKRAIDAWPAVKLLSDPSRQLSVRDVLPLADKFTPPSSVGATLGVRPDAVWLRIPFEVASTSDAQWILDINHPDLNRIEVLLLHKGEVIQRSLLGTEVPPAERPLRGRTPALPLVLAPGEAYELLLRVTTQGAMILPITLNTPSGMLGAAIDEQMLQGVLTGLALCLIFYSMAQWYSLREPLFAQYALLTSGSLVYSLHFFGVGQQYLWGHSPWVTSHAVGLSSLLALTGCFLFMGQALEGHNPQSRFLRIMRWGAVLTTALALLLGLILSLATLFPDHGIDLSQITGARAMPKSPEEKAKEHKEGKHD